MIVLCLIAAWTVVAAGPVAVAELNGPYRTAVSNTSAPFDDTAPLDASGGRPADGLAAAPAPRRDDYRRSLLYSGLLGLAISLTGLGMVIRRRRQW